MFAKYVKNEKCIAEYFVSLFLRFLPGSALTRKVKRFHSLFFRGINKTRNLHEIQKVYSERFIFCGVFRENTPKIPMKCEI